MNRTHCLSKPPAGLPARKRGFALLVTIVLVAFLVLILVGLASFTRVETQVASNSQSIAQARQNALLGLQVALGQLQRYAGPDQRVTATADIRRTSDTNGEPNPSVRNRHFTGVWSTVATDPMVPPSLDPNAPLAWLVSGNEDPAAPLAANPTIDYSAAGSSIQLVGTNSTSDPIDHVRVPLVPLSSSQVPGTGNTSTPIGRYAYWIGDEGVKARIDLNDKLAPRQAATAGTPASFTPDPTQEAQRLSAAQRFGVERITGLADLSSAFGSDTNAADAMLRLDRVLDTQQLPFYSNTITPDATRRLFHHITPHSRSVLSDTAFGGLRSDLAYLFQQNTAAAFRTEINRVLTGADSLSATDANTQIVPPGFPAADWAQGPTWHQLRSFYLSGRRTSQTPAGALNASGEAVPRAHRPDAHGIHPIVLHHRVRVGVQIRRLGVDQNRLEGVFAPLVVLANPYNVPLAPADYLIRTRFNGPSKLYLKEPALYSSAGNPPGIRNSWASNRTDTVFFRIEQAAFAPGEARVFTLRAGGTGWDSGMNSYTWSNGGRYPLENDLNLDNASVADTHADTTVIATDAELADLAGVAGNAFTHGGEIFFQLYLDDGSTANPGNARLLQLTQVHPGGNANFGTLRTADIGPTPRWGAQTNDAFGFRLVSPLEISAGSPATAAVNFYQSVNWRAPLRTLFGQAAGIGGNTNDTGIFANPGWLTSILINNDNQTVSWGMRNRGSTPNNIFNSPAGNSNSPTALPRAVFFDLPAPERPVVSLGQFQHFNASGFSATTNDTPSGERDRSLSASPAYAIGHGRASIYVRRENYRDSHNLAGTNPDLLRDTSYILNRALWDSYFISTVPQSGSFDFSSAADVLGNPRLAPFRTELAPDNITPYRDSPRAAAKNLLLEGGFNINSTSVEAWRALFSSLNNIPYPGDNTSLTGAFARTLAQPDGYPTTSGGNNGVSAEAWSGYRNLTHAQIDELATRMVQEVRLRGPFAGLSDFVNRRLVPNSSPRAATGLMAAMEAAIQATETASNDDARVNNLTGGRTSYGLYFRRPASTSSNRVKDIDHHEPALVSGIPGILSQRDLLQALGPVLTARSDTFIIRTYGEALNPATGVTSGQAWLEAVVQRLPDYVDNTDDPTVSPSAASTTNQNFGRRFHVVSFRWLSNSDI